MTEPRAARWRRVMALVAVAVTSVVAFTALGGVGLAQNAVVLVQYQYGKKVTICHKGKNTIRISVRAWTAHKRHGDVMGSCAVAKHAKMKHQEEAQAERMQDDAGKQQGKAAERQGKQGKQHGKSAGEQQGKAAGKQQGTAEQVRETIAQKVSSGNGNGKGSRSGNAGGNGNGNGNGRGK